MAGILNGEERVYLGGVSDRERRTGASGLEIVVNVPNVNSVVSSPGRKRKGLCHGADCGQSIGFSRYGWSVMGPDYASLSATSVSFSGLGGEG